MDWLVYRVRGSRRPLLAESLDDRYLTLAHIQRTITTLRDRNHLREGDVDALFEVDPPDIPPERRRRQS
jgi:hypothetical protein